MKKILSISLLLSIVVVSLFAQAPANYYSNAEGYTEAALKTKLGEKVGPHTERSYGDLWTDFRNTDKRADGKVWDIYSNVTNYTFGTNQCGNYSGEGSCYNREHSFPKSWFNDATPMYTDLFHLYPSDGYVNGKRSNFPFGEVGSTTYTSANGYCKLGSCSFPGYSGTVFEPTDDLKGDMARTYFYMVTAYENVVDGWNTDNTNASAHLNSTKYPALNTWSVALFLKWNAQDPVSTKEINRNNAIYGIQRNRNPFIDHPELAEYIWGAHKGEAWSLTSGVSNLKIEFSISPNPVKDELTINTNESDLSYSIFNLNGQILKSEKLATSKIVPVNQFDNGMYLIQLQAGNRKTIQKFIINK